jgi:hypothetical protein
MQKYRGFAEIPKAARRANAFSLWAKAELRHTVSNPAPRDCIPSVRQTACRARRRHASVT